MNKFNSSLYKETLPVPGSVSVNHYNSADESRFYPAHIFS
jgi:hypothetical protein